jgi:AcrR family transcriptional regulator
MLFLKGKKRPRGQRAGLTTAIIIAKAGQLLEKKGEITIEPLAKSCGVGPTTIRARFKGGAGQICSEIARAALDGVARPCKARQTPEEYLTDVFWNALKKLSGRRVIARLIPIELFRNPILSPRLAERILACVAELGAEDKYLPRGLQRVIAGLSDMVLMECSESDKANREDLANRIGLSITALSVEEYPMLTDNLEPLTNHARYSAAPSSRSTAEKYALATIASLRIEIEGHHPEDRIEDLQNIFNAPILPENIG